MKKYLLWVIVSCCLSNTAYSQNFPDSVYQDSNSLLLAKFTHKDLKQYIGQRAKVIFNDPDIKNFKRFVLINPGRIGYYKGFDLIYSEKFFLVVEVDKTIDFRRDKKKPPEWYFKKLLRKKIIVIEIPLHLLLEKDNK